MNSYALLICFDIQIQIIYMMLVKTIALNLSKQIEKCSGLFWYSDSRIVTCETLKFHG